MIKKLIKLAKYTALGAGAGYAASRVTSTSFESEHNAKVGGALGAGIGASAFMIPQIIKNKTAREAIGTGIKEASKVVFRRIRGRIIPIRVKA